MARTTLSSSGEDVFVGGSDVEVFGTNGGGEVITVVTGNIRLDASFNRGGDTLVLPGAATSYTAYLAGSEVIFTRSDGSVVASVPIGTAGMEIQFDGGNSRTLLFDDSIGQATLEGQVISTDPTSPTPIGQPGAAPASTFDVVGSNTTVEGDSAARQLVFTISLDRAVTAADGPLTLNYQTQNGTAVSGADYTATSGQVTFAVGQQTATVTVPVLSDSAIESAESLSLLLTGARLRNGPETLVGTVDTVTIGDGALTSTRDANFTGVKRITFVSDGDGDDQSVTVDNDNVPPGGLPLIVNAGSAIATEAFTFNATAVTNYSVNVTTGAGNDTINTTNTRADTIATGAGDDRVEAAGGDTITAGLGNDTIVLEEGNNSVFAGEGDDSFFVNNEAPDFGNPGANRLFGEGGNDTILVAVSANLRASDAFDGGADTDTIDIVGTVVDAQFTNVTNFEILRGGNGGSANFTLGAEAQEAGIRTIQLTEGGPDVVNASAFTAGLTVASSGGDDVITTGSGVDLIVGGLGRDTLTGGAGADTFRYQSSNDSRVLVGGADSRDRITDFVSGEDKIDLLTLTDPTAVGQTVRFNGNVNTLTEGQNAINGTASNGDLDLVFVRDTNTLWVDVDNNAMLNDSDMQIILQGVTNLTAADVNNPHRVGVSADIGQLGELSSPAESFNPAEQFATLRWHGAFEALHIA